MRSIVRSTVSSSINGSHEALGCEWLPLNWVCLIEDEVLRFRHVAREEETSRKACRLIFIKRSGCVNMCPRGCPFGAVILSHYNSLAKRLRLNHFKMIRC